MNDEKARALSIYVCSEDVREDMQTPPPPLGATKSCSPAPIPVIHRHFTLECVKDTKRQFGSWFVTFTYRYVARVF